MLTLNKVVQDWYAARLKAYYSQLYRARLTCRETGEDPAEVYPQDRELSPAATRLVREDCVWLPDEVREAFGYYWRHIEQADIGSARVYLVPAAGRSTYAVRVRTDGDDGYLEVYDAKGKFLAAGRTYIEIVAWGSRPWLRSQVEQPDELPAELQDADERTLWGEPLPEK
jgi:hypothetical protein